MESACRAFKIISCVKSLIVIKRAQGKINCSLNMNFMNLRKMLAAKNLQTN